MQAKALEVRDHNTFIAILAVDMNPREPYPRNASMTMEEFEQSVEASNAQRYLLRRVGYPCDGRPNVMITYLGGTKRADNDPYGWPGEARTYPVAHQYIIEHWHEIKDGDVIDVEFIKGETTTKKLSERFAPYGKGVG